MISTIRGSVTIRSFLGQSLTNAPRYSRSSRKIKQAISEIAMFSPYRDAAKILWLLKISKTGASTVRDKVLSLVGKGLDLRQNQRDAILQDNGFDKETGRPVNEGVLGKIMLSLDLPEEPTFEQMAQLTDRYNDSRNKDRDLLVSSVSFRHNFELDSFRHTYIINR